MKVKAYFINCKPYNYTNDKGETFKGVHGFFFVPELNVIAKVKVGANIASDFGTECELNVHFGNEKYYFTLEG